MTANETRWPHIGAQELRILWELYRPSFIRLDDVEQELPLIREQFLQWLESRGIDLAEGRETQLGLRRRVRLERVSLVRRGDEAQALVTMSLGGRIKEASLAGPSVPEQILRMSALATLEAVQGLVPVFFTLEKALTLDGAAADAKEIAVVVVRDASGVNDRLVGSSIVSVSHPEAAARATLHAINRRAEPAARP